ncbi:MAG: hypothetical protein GY754_11205 [bacterium]|nr:hypothetical protein [bacterium]
MDDWLEIFMAGDYEKQGNYTEQDIDRMISRFNTEQAGVPNTIDHNKKGPAYGWVNQLKRTGKTLLANFKQVPEAFQNVINKGYFKNRSVEITNDGKGPRLRAVTWLGAKTPQVKDLEEIEFGADEEVICINFNEQREDQTVNEDELKKKIVELENQLSETVKEFSEKETKYQNHIKTLSQNIDEQSNKAKKKDVKDFCEALLKEGKLLPKEKDYTEQLLMGMDDTEIKEFSEGEGKDITLKKSTAYDLFKETLRSRPVTVDYNEIVTGKKISQYDFSADDDVDPESAKLFSEAEKMATDKNIPLSEACKIVSDGE